MMKTSYERTRNLEDFAVPPFFGEHRFSLIDSDIPNEGIEIDYPMITGDAGLPLTQKPPFQPGWRNQTQPRKRLPRDLTMSFVTLKRLRFSIHA